jgi:uncharacterized protein YcgI (DUF1989 family)
MLTIPARRGKAAYVERGQQVRVINTHGQQVDCVIAFSACPQDMVPINGVACTPTDAHFEIL